LKRPLLVLAVLLGVIGAPGGGPVEVRLQPMGRGRPQEGIARGVIPAPPERVFRAVADVEHWHEFMPFLRASDARLDKDGSVLSTQRLDLPFLGERHYRIRFRGRVERGDRLGRETLWRAEWSYVPGSGNLTGLRGSWTLTAAPGGGTLAICRLWMDAGMLPSLMDRATEKSLPWIFDGLRQHVRRSRYDTP
jgi:ribosome-associated toxin RatA of RatAB toxin-antitoxin module